MSRSLEARGVEDWGGTRLGKEVGLGEGEEREEREGGGGCVIACSACACAVRQPTGASPDISSRKIRHALNGNGSSTISLQQYR
jgi:hypothetical protein